MLADDTAGLLEALNISRAAVLGHSMGGFVAQALVLSRPELVSRLILSATNFGGPNHIPVTPEALAVLTDMETDPIERLRRGIAVSTTPGFAEAHPEIVDEWVAHRVENRILPQPYQAQIAIGMALMAQEASFEHRLKNVQVPTLIMFGADDKVVPPGNAELLAREIPNNTVKILPQAGHFYPFDATDAAVAAIVEFLKA
jgi:pimeloyl-ACP methyl ester carboxylesterase